MTHDDHEPIVLKKPTRHQRLAFTITTLLAIVVVIVGWSVTVLGEIRSGFGETKNQVVEAVSAAETVKENTAKSRSEVGEMFGGLQDAFQPFVEAVENQEKVMEVIADEFIEELEEGKESEVVEIPGIKELAEKIIEESETL